MNQFKPRSKTAFLHILKDLNISKPAKNIIADIAIEIEGAAYDAVKELKRDVLATLQLVDKELREHDEEYQHLTSPDVKDAVQRCIKKLK
jgi:hypothetical protein